jgi:hypothetical protein
MWTETEMGIARVMLSNEQSLKMIFFLFERHLVQPWNLSYTVSHPGSHKLLLLVDGFLRM